MTSPGAEPRGDDLRDVLARVEAGGRLAPGEASRLRRELEAASAERDAFARREKVYRDTVRQQNRDFDRKLLEMSVLRRVGDVIAAALRLDDMLERLLEILVAEFRLGGSSVMRLDGETGELSIEAGKGSGGSGPGAGAPALRLGDGIAGWVAASRESLLVNDVSNDVRFLHADSRPPRGSLICVPLVAEGRVLGVLNVSIPRIGAFDAHHVRLLEIIASQVAGALVGRRLFHELRELSTRLEDQVSVRTSELQARTLDLRRKNEQVTQLYFSLERAQQELEQRNLRLVTALAFNDSIVETINVGISVLGSDRRFVTWNRALEELTGGALGKEETIGKRLDEVPEGLRETFGLGKDLVDTLDRGRAVTVREHVVDRDDGARLHLNVHHLPVEAAGGPAQVITVVEDISSNVALHEQKVRSERLAAINETMVSVNHEVNNPLAVILGYSQMLLEKRDDRERSDHWEEEAVRTLRTIEAEAIRIGEITRKLSHLIEPVTTPYLAAEGVRMVDLNQSR